MIRRWNFDIYPDIDYPAAGDIAEPGTYSCLNCPHDNSKEDKAIVILNQKNSYRYVQYAAGLTGLNLNRFFKPVFFHFECLFCNLQVII